MRLSTCSESVQYGVKAYAEQVLCCGDTELCGNIETHEKYLYIEHHKLNYHGKEYDYFKLFYNYEIIAKYFDGIMMEYNTPDMDVSPLTYEFVDKAKEMFVHVIRERTHFTKSIVRIQD